MLPFQARGGPRRALHCAQTAHGAWLIEAQLDSWTLGLNGGHMPCRSTALAHIERCCCAVSVLRAGVPSLPQLMPKVLVLSSPQTTLLYTVFLRTFSVHFTHCPAHTQQDDDGKKAQDARHPDTDYCAKNLKFDVPACCACRPAQLAWVQLAWAQSCI